MFTDDAAASATKTKIRPLVFSRDERVNHLLGTDKETNKS